MWFLLYCSCDQSAAGSTYSIDWNGKLKWHVNFLYLVYKTIQSSLEFFRLALCKCCCLNQNFSFEHIVFSISDFDFWKKYSSWFLLYFPICHLKQLLEQRKWILISLKKTIFVNLKNSLCNLWKNLSVRDRVLFA